MKRTKSKDFRLDADWLESMTSSCDNKIETKNIENKQTKNQNFDLHDFYIG